MMSASLDVAVDRGVGWDVVRLEPELSAVLLELDALKAIEALNAEVESAVGEFAPAVLPPLVRAGMCHSHLKGLGAAARYWFCTNLAII
jgi:hypothetical protein